MLFHPKLFASSCLSGKLTSVPGHRIFRNDLYSSSLRGELMRHSFHGRKTFQVLHQGSIAMDKNVAAILNYFDQINAIPRCSRNEARLGRWLRNWAATRRLQTHADGAGNLVVQVPASDGMENRPTVVLQGHMDMVCEKTPDSHHDFSRDPIRSKTEGDWLVADRTTLGADNGMALAYALSLADDQKIRRPPMELLFTVDEETGLKGVQKMAPDLISGRILINLDSEDEGVFTVGCAGWVESVLSMDLPTASLSAGATLYKVEVGGLKGGHSGIDIDKRRGNANKILARILAGIGRRAPFQIVTLKGGTRHNAIARDAEAVLAFKGADAQVVMQAVTQTGQILGREYAAADPGLYVHIEPHCGPAPFALTWENSQQVLALLLALPHGVAGMSGAFPGVVETSSNLATVTAGDGGISILSSQRSARVSKLEEITEMIQAVAGPAGARVQDGNHYPPWEPDMNAPLLKTSQKVYRGLYGEEPLLQVIHAGLECAVIGGLCPGMQMISFGPTIRNSHSPAEKLYIPSVGKVWRFLVALLGALDHGGEGITVGRGDPGNGA
jgi:dipeptidase D